MSQGSDSVLDRPTEPAPRPVRRRIGAAVALLIVVVTGWAITKHVMTGGLKSSEINAATSQIARGIVTGQTSHFTAAEEHLLDAASVSVFDTYPTFLISVVRRLESRDALGPQKGDAILSAILDRDWQQARDLAAEQGESGSKPRVYWERFIGDVQSEVERGAGQSSTRTE